jgi:Na+-transporting NADH:ubiquinone oxidoreductase subunit B
MNKGMIKIQAPMMRVLYALVPISIASIYFFGWRALAMLIVVNTAGFVAEYLFTRSWNEPVSSAVFVTNVLFCLSLPPGLPFWMAALGVVFAVVFGKMVFGGFGKNVFNPALAGRAFLYVSFPIQMTAQWWRPVGGAPGGFAAWAPSAVTGATPMNPEAASGAYSYGALFWGNVPGCLGETSAFLVLLGGLYIVWKKAADSRIVISGFAATLGLGILLWAAGVETVRDPLAALLGGSYLFGLFFFATEPVSAPKTPEAKWIYGAAIGMLTVLIRAFSVWDEGMMFAILVANMFAPITDHAIREWKKGRKKRR